MLPQQSQINWAALGITVLLLPIVYGTVYYVLVGGSSFSNDIKAMVVGTVVGSLLGAISGYWLGGVHTPPVPKGEVASPGGNDAHQP